ncbi:MULTISPECIES: tubulin-like doman-containing protein [unclassified Blastococcus]
MYKICVVGLGGSGGKTLQFLMDQLGAELAKLGWGEDHLPRCWEFVHVDVPPVPDGVGAGLPPTVPKQGGTYIPVSSPTDSYAVLDRALQSNLISQPTGSQLRQLVRWRPHAARVTTPITLGAGQYRAVGRLLTLARAGVVYDRLVPVAERLNQAGSDHDLAAVARLLGLPSSGTQGSMVLVVSSLAGGTGASMTLDVCNLLRAVAAQVPNFRAESLAFLYTPDVFDKLEPGQRAGVNANALGTVSELMSAMAARQRTWTPAEWSVYGGVPRPPGVGRGPELVFPVGSYNGISGARFGDGKADTIYRGFARSLTALFMSEAQQNQLMAYAIGNLGVIAGSVADNSLLSLQPARGGADVESNEPLVFGSLGFASIGLGRDRYAEYVAQRLARQGVERLLRGHVDLAVRQGLRSPQQAVTDTAVEFYPQFLAWAGLPDVRARDGQVLRGLVHDVWPEDAREALSARLTRDVLGPALQPGVTGSGDFFAHQMAGYITSTFDRNVLPQADRELREGAVRWVPAIQARLESALLQVIGDRGIPAAERILQMFAADLQYAAEALDQAAGIAQSPQAIAQNVTAELQTLTNTIDVHHGAIGQATAKLRQHYTEAFLRRAAAMVGDLLTQAQSDLLQPLTTALGQCRGELESSEAVSALSAPTATVATDLVQQWPVGDDVPPRFATAQNEVLLEDIGSYPRSYADHLVRTFSAGGGSASLTPARSEELALFEALTWLHSDSRSRLRSADRLAGLDAVGVPARIGRRSEWWPQALSNVSSSRPASYELQLHHRAVLQGARAWVGRRGEVLGNFIAEGLDVYLNRPGASAHEQAEIARRFADRFGAALQLAAPLVGVDAQMVRAVHDRPVMVGYQFSELPFGTSPGVVAQLVEGLKADSSVEPLTVERFEQAVSTVSRNRIDILGTYAHLYNPIVFSSLQKPIRKQWTESASAQLRGAFWTMRRGRSLTDFTPVSSTWLQSVVTGWLVGRLTGEVLLPGEGPIVDGGVAVWSTDLREFARLPHPLLGAEVPQRDAPGWGLVSAVVESLPLAIAMCDGDTQMSALRPYQSLFQLGRHLQDPRGGTPSEALLPWLRDGIGRSGEGPRGVLTPPTSVEERLLAAQEWCQALQADAIKLLPQDPQFPGPRGGFSEITPHNFWDVPREWELARQLVTATEQLLVNLQVPAYTGAGHQPPANPDHIQVQV